MRTALYVIMALVVLVLAALWLRGMLVHAQGAHRTMVSSRLVTMEIGGMTCAGCVDKIQHSVSAVHGVRRVEVSLRNQRAEVLCDDAVADTALTAAVRRAGPEYLGLILAR